MHPIDKYGPPLAMVILACLIGFALVAVISNARKWWKATEARLAAEAAVPNWTKFLSNPQKEDAEQWAWQRYFQGRQQAPSVQMIGGSIWIPQDDTTASDWYKPLTDGISSTRRRESILMDNDRFWL